MNGDWINWVIAIIANALMYFNNEGAKNKAREYVAEISLCSSSEEAMQLRAQYKNAKREHIVTDILVIVISSFVLIVLKGYALSLIGILYFLFNVIVNISSNNFAERIKLIDAVSTYTKEKFMEENKQFILYLRAFESDQYNGLSMRSLRKVDSEDGQVAHVIDEQFSESKFVQAVSLISSIPIAAVGMPREMDQPDDAAIRLYVNGETWQEDVLELIESARLIYVLVASRDSCLWEINQLKDHLHKTVFIIDDIEEYNQAKETLSSEMQFPAIPDDMLSDYNHFVMYKKGDVYVFHGFIFSSVGYRSVAARTVELVMERPIKLDGLFKKMGECFDNILMVHGDDSMPELCDEMNKLCPYKISDHFELMSCDRHGLGGMLIVIKADNDSAESISGNKFGIKLITIDSLYNEIGESFLSFYKTFGKEILVNFVNPAGDTITGFTIVPDDLRDDDVPHLLSSV